MGHPANAEGHRGSNSGIHSCWRDQPDTVVINSARLDCNLLQQLSGNTPRLVTEVTCAKCCMLSTAGFMCSACIYDCWLAVYVHQFCTHTSIERCVVPVWHRSVTVSKYMLLTSCNTQTPDGLNQHFHSHIYGIRPGMSLVADGASILMPTALTP